MRMLLVSTFFPEVTQQIHSLRASGVISSHTARALGIEATAFRKSAGSLCIVSGRRDSPATLMIYGLFDRGLKFFRFIRSYAVDPSVFHNYFNRVKT